MSYTPDPTGGEKPDLRLISFCWVENLRQMNDSDLFGPIKNFRVADLALT